MATELDQLSITTIRTLSIDAINQAHSGHPGLPMGAAPMAYTLWTRAMKHNPHHPQWFNRDRFVLSAGHGSMLLYSLLYLFDYGLTLDDLKNFRQWGSRTPGHPEFGRTAGVEATTGPLGQGLAMAVGMAMAEAHLGAVYNRPGYSLVDHQTYVLCGDGDLMEGVAAEAASLAGHLKLGKLIVLYDSNKVSLDGRLDQSFSENVCRRFAAYGWQTLYVADGNRVDAIEKALEEARRDRSRPSLIEVRTVIGYGAPHVQGTNQCHGSPLGEAETLETKKAYGWDHAPFFVPAEVLSHFKRLAEQGERAEEEWFDVFSAYEKQFPEPAAALKNAVAGFLPEHFAERLPVYGEGTKKATRAASGEVLNGLAGQVRELFGGSADLASSTKTTIKDSPAFLPGSYEGRNIWFGVREFAMSAAVNGMTLHGGVRAFGATFFTFSDYAKPAIRLAALMKIPSIFVFTHDSLAVGEDGPTHEPIEQLAGLRAIPNLNVIRPADGNETREAWKIALESRTTPTALVLTRQGVETFAGEREGAAEGVRRGGYIVSREKKQAEAVLIATGSEVELAIRAQALLAREAMDTRVVSLPSWRLFDRQPQAYRDSVLPPELENRVGIEMAASLGWERYVGDKGVLWTIDRFGASAPGPRVLKEFAFTPEQVADGVRMLVKGRRK